MGLWENETVTPEWDQARLILRIGEADYERILTTLTENIDKSREFIDIIK